MIHNKEEIGKIVSDFINEEFLYDKPELELTNSLNILEQGILDSMDIFRLIQFIEETMNVVFEPDEMMQENFKSVDCIVDFIKSKQSNC